MFDNIEIVERWLIEENIKCDQIFNKKSPNLKYFLPKCQTSPKIWPRLINFGENKQPKISTFGTILIFFLGIHKLDRLLPLIILRLKHFNEHFAPPLAKNICLTKKNIENLVTLENFHLVCFVTDVNLFSEEFRFAFHRYQIPATTRSEFTKSNRTKYFVDKND